MPLMLMRGLAGKSSFERRLRVARVKLADFCSLHAPVHFGNLGGIAMPPGPLTQQKVEGVRQRFFRLLHRMLGEDRLE